MPNAVDPHWEPLTVEEVVALMAPFPARWWISGGHALELHLGRSWRSHEDIDVGILRSDAPLLRGALPGLEIHLAAGGALSAWAGDPPSPERSENNLWARPEAGGPWVVDFTMNAGDAAALVYRRDPSLRVSWSHAIRHGVEGVPYLAPALQLLYKGEHPREQDHIDARETIPHLDEEGRDLLRMWLASGHPWRSLLGST